MAARVRLTHPERIYWPAAGDSAGVTKAGLAAWYGLAWPRMAPHVAGRPLALLRCPEGIDGPRFFQKHPWKGIGAQVLTPADPKNPGDRLIAVADLPGLTALVQGAALEIHTWQSSLAALERPDQVVVDLDPGEGVDWEALVAAARDVRARLQAAGLASFVKTSGGKGLHVVAPLLPKAGWAALKAFAAGLARAMAADDPARYVATVAKAEREGRILVDYLRNGRNNTAAVAYGARARPGAPVSMPLAWEELAATRPAFTVATAPARLMAADPWADFRAAAAPLPAGKRAAS